MRDGYRATGIDRIIEEAQVAKMTMYRHFSSKEDLILEVLTQHASEFSTEIDALIEEATNVEDKVEAVFDWYEEWFASADFRGCMFSHALAEYSDAESAIFRKVVDQKEGVRSRLRKILEERLPDNQADDLSSVLLMLLEGATLLAQMGQTEGVVSNARRGARQLLRAHLSTDAE